jgi:hypothetical protein
MKARDDFEFDFAVSFAGENRTIVEQFASILKAEGFSVYYDAWNESDMWGRDLYQHLDDVYSEKAQYCVIFLSAEYAVKAWTNHELKSAQARAFRENEAYILPVRLDDTVIPGIRATTGYLDLRKKTIQDIADLAIQKIQAGTRGNTKKGGKAKSKSGKSKPAAPIAIASTINLQIKKEFTEHDRDTFLEEAFEFTAKFFENSLAALKSHNERIVGKFQRINANHFTATIYRDGQSVSACGIRLWTFATRTQIAYSTDPTSTNSMNEAVDVDDDGQAMFLKATGYGMFSGRGKTKNQLTPHETAEMFWSILIEPLQR